MKTIRKDLEKLRTVRKRKKSEKREKNREFSKKNTTSSDSFSTYRNSRHAY